MTDVESIMSAVTDMLDEEVEKLRGLVANEDDRRKTIRAGLDPGEQLQLQTLIEMIQKRTGVKEADAKHMIYTHPLQQRPSPTKPERRR